MIEVYNLNLERVAVLEHAYDIDEDEKINALGFLRFSLPLDDPKRQYCRPRWFARYNGGELYRILPIGQVQDESGANQYECEHVLATLMDDVLFGYHAPMSGTTAAYLQYILGQQKTKRWVLGRCAFTRYFEYAWEQENLLGALFSVANPLSGYIWRTDTSVYPWVVHLDALDTTGTPELYWRSGHNLIDFTSDYDYTQLCTKLYPLGYGEGINQLTIQSVNNGVSYLENTAASDEYGQISRIWIDRRYQDAESLKAAAQTMLDELSQPIFTHHCTPAVLEGEVPPAIGRRVRILPADGGQIDTFITELKTKHGEFDEVEVVLANKSTDIATTVADLADRARIEQAYAQGATQLYAIAQQTNASTQEGALLDFYIPAEMRYVNKVLLKVQLESFRSYSGTTSTAESKSYTSSAGGGKSYTSNSGGGDTVTSESGGGKAETTHGASNVDMEHISTSTTDGHSHTIYMSTYHEHEVEFPEHSHDVEIDDHTHRVVIDDHQHTFTIPAHSHEITPGIFRSGSPKSFRLVVNGKQVASFASLGAELDITEYLIADGGIIPRGTWHTVTIVPDDLAYVAMNLYLQGFVQSRGDMTV